MKEKDNYIHKELVDITNEKNEILNLNHSYKKHIEMLEEKAEFNLKRMNDCLSLKNYELEKLMEKNIELMNKIDYLKANTININTQH